VSVYQLNYYASDSTFSLVSELLMGGFVEGGGLVDFPFRLDSFDSKMT
jgi:hypothetical protein